MTDFTRKSLLKTKEEIIRQVEEGKLAVKTGAELLGITRQGLWKLRLNYQQYGQLALKGRKRGPKSYFRVHNRTPEWVEEKIEDIYLKYGVGPDTLLWIIEDDSHDELGEIQLSRSTIYRILVRRRVLKVKEGQKRNPHPLKYTKGYPGEEVQADTTEPYGKNKGVMFNLVDDYSRWARSYFYQQNNSLNARLCLEHFLSSVPFPVTAIRVDNGSEFKKHFQVFCNTYGIRLIRNPIHTPEHNGKVERLHRTVDEECLWRIPPKDRNNLELVNYQLAKYNHWYNTKRRHQGYKMNKLTPQRKIETFIINNQTNSLYKGEVNETLILYMVGLFFEIVLK